MTRPDGKPIRIIYPLYDLQSSSLSNWLMGILRRLDPKHFKVDFLLHNPSPGYFAEEARDLGARIIYCPNPAALWTYIPEFKKIIRDYGPYGVIHCHMSNLSFHMMIAHDAGIPVRISHIHMEWLKGAKGIGLKPKLKWLFYRYLNPSLMIKYSSGILAVSKQAAQSTLGPKIKSARNIEILPCGLELDDFDRNIDRGKIRQEFQIPESALVIGHAGRFSWEKNQSFLIKLAKEIEKVEPNMRLLLLGEGPLQEQIKVEAVKANLSQKVIFAGHRPDIPEIMRGAMDVFVFPSLFEGLGMALVEAQASGLPCIVSENILDEAICTDFLVQRISLEGPVQSWVSAILNTRGNNLEANRIRALEAIKNTFFNINKNVERLKILYARSLS
jgi:glycosyltransferase involved in cell wall biosynthesis